MLGDWNLYLLAHRAHILIFQVVYSEPHWATLCTSYSGLLSLSGAYMHVWLHKLSEGILCCLHCSSWVQTAHSWTVSENWTESHVSCWCRCHSAESTVAPICTNLREETAYLHPALCRTDLAISMHMLFTTGCSEHHEMAHRGDYQPGIHCTSINRNFGLYAAVMVTTCHVFWTTWSGALVPHSLMSIFNSRQHHWWQPTVRCHRGVVTSALSPSR